jgi:hypothetical protein
MSHAPGPWWWDGKFGESNLRCGDASEDECDGSVIRYEPYEGMWLSRYGCSAEDDANARLIAASPCLLKELEHLVFLLGPLEAGGILNVPGLATLNGARAAIAKARCHQ